MKKTATAAATMTPEETSTAFDRHQGVRAPPGSLPAGPPPSGPPPPGPPPPGGGWSGGLGGTDGPPVVPGGTEGRGDQSVRVGSYPPASSPGPGSGSGGGPGGGPVGRFSEGGSDDTALLLRWGIHGPPRSLCVADRHGPQAREPRAGGVSPGRPRGRVARPRSAYVGFEP
ncbi:hypothetical protein GCM10020000_72830 [Streptomyces olivoverticillatus]